MDERRIAEIVEEVVKEITALKARTAERTEPCGTPNRTECPVRREDMSVRKSESESLAETLSSTAEKSDEKIEEKFGLLLDSPIEPAALLRMKAATPARIGVGKAGARLKTKTALKLRADHAAARDAVLATADDNVLASLNLKKFKTVVKDKDEYLTRPDLGRRFENEELKKITAEAGSGADVLIYASDGLSSTAINANLKDVLPVIIDGLKVKGLKVAKPFYVEYGRVGAMDSIGESTGAAVVAVLLGERPGLMTAESMSAYIAYKPTVGMPEARRTVVSNIHKGGTAPVEAGAYIADIIERIFKAKKSGVELSGGNAL